MMARSLGPVKSTRNAVAREPLRILKHAEAGQGSTCGTVYHHIPPVIHPTQCQKQHAAGPCLPVGWTPRLGRRLQN